MVNKNSLQDSCSGPEFAIGEMYALRQFRSRVDEDGKLVLTAVMHETEAWAEGINHAKCTASATLITKDVYDALDLLTEEQRHERQIQIYTAGSSYLLSHSDIAIPKPDCTCGFYAYHSLDALNENAYTATWTGIVRVEGRIVIGEKGLRAERAEIVALVEENRREELRYAKGGVVSGNFGALTTHAISANSITANKIYFGPSFDPSHTVASDVDVFINKLERYAPRPFSLQYDPTVIEYVAHTMKGSYTPAGDRLHDIFKIDNKRPIAQRFHELYLAKHKFVEIDRQRSKLVARKKRVERQLEGGTLVRPETRYWSAGMLTWLGATSTVVATGAMNQFLIAASAAVGFVAGWFAPSLFQKSQTKRLARIKRRINFLDYEIGSALEVIAHARTRLASEIESSRRAAPQFKIASPGTNYVGQFFHSVTFSAPAGYVPAIPANVSIAPPGYFAAEPVVEPDASSFQDSLDKVRNTYPGVVVFQTIEEMLQEFPLTGPEEFRDSTQNS